jgi:hypothetical protein
VALLNEPSELLLLLVVPEWRPGSREVDAFGAQSAEPRRDRARRHSNFRRDLLVGHPSQPQLCGNLSTVRRLTHEGCWVEDTWPVCHPNRIAATVAAAASAAERNELAG